MKEQLYITKTRYEYYGHDGIEWTKWFVLNGTPMSKIDAEEFIKTIKKLYNDIDKRTKLKHEYKIVPLSEHENEMAEIDKIISAAHTRDEKYFASDEWKELKHKKYVARKERKIRQEEYKKMQEELSK